MSARGEVAEGVKTSEAITKIGQEKGIYVPIAHEVHAITEGKNIKESLDTLMK